MEGGWRGVKAAGVQAASHRMYAMLNGPVEEQYEEAAKRPPEAKGGCTAGCSFDGD